MKVSFFTMLGLPTADDNLDGYRISDVTSQGKIDWFKTVTYIKGGF